VTVHQCLNGRAPPYLSEHCIPVSSADTRRHLRSAVAYLPYRVSGSTLTAVGRSQLLARWPGTLSRILSRIQRAAQTFRRLLKTYLFARYSCIQRIRGSKQLCAIQIHALTQYRDRQADVYHLTNGECHVTAPEPINRWHITLVTRRLHIHGTYVVLSYTDYNYTTAGPCWTGLLSSQRSVISKENRQEPAISVEIGQTPACHLASRVIAMQDVAVNISLHYKKAKQCKELHKTLGHFWIRGSRRSWVITGKQGFI